MNTVTKIRLPRDGAEYALFTFSPATFPNGTVLEAQIEGAWSALDTTGAVPRLLLRGPDAPGGTAGVLVTKDQAIRVRIRSAPEIVIRGAGYVTLVS